MCVRSWGEGGSPLPTGSGPPVSRVRLDARGLWRSVRLQAPDDVGDVGELLLEVALMLLERLDQLVAVRRAVAKQQQQRGLGEALDSRVDRPAPPSTVPGARPMSVHRIYMSMTCSAVYRGETAGAGPALRRRPIFRLRR